MKSTLRLIISLLMLTAAAAQATPILNVDATTQQLLGASNVDINGTSYDVVFLDGTCGQVFDGCNDTSDFDFQSAEEAMAASQALIDQVFVDSELGNFDSDPASINGCTDNDYCHAYTPYMVSIGFVNILSSGFTQNGPLETFDWASSGIQTATYVWLWGDYPHITWAKWTPAATATDLPEAGTLAVLGIGFAGMLLARRRSQRPAAAGSESPAAVSL